MLVGTPNLTFEAKRAHHEGKEHLVLGMKFSKQQPHAFDLNLKKREITGEMPTGFRHFQVNYLENANHNLITWIQSFRRAYLRLEWQT